MKCCSSNSSLVLVLVVIGICTPSALSQTPVIGSLEGPYAPLQSSVQMAGYSYSPGSVSYGPAGTPLVLTGSDLGASGIVYFTGYKKLNNQEVVTSTAEANVTMWTSNMIFLTAPSCALSCLVTVYVEGKTSNQVPFIVTSGTYSGSCPAFPATTQLQITTGSLHDGTAGQSYSATLAAEGGTGPYLWSITSQTTLPTGLTLNASTGTISGTPSSASGPADITFAVTDSSAPSKDDQAVLSLTVESQAMTQAAVYSYCVPGPSNSSCISSNSGFDGTGDILQYQDSVNGSWTFSYDSLDRLATGTATSGGLSQGFPYACWNYDNFGNRLQQEMSSEAFQSGSGGPNACQPQQSAQLLTSINIYLNSHGVDPGTNQITSTNARGVIATLAYDGSGNMENDGDNSYLYDAEGRICAVQTGPILGVTTMTGYLYDAEGNRVAKGTLRNCTSISNCSCDPATNGFTLTEGHVLGQGGEELTTLNGQGTWLRSNVYAGGELIATYDTVTDPSNSSPAQIPELHFQLTDPLGTRRMQTSSVGQPETDFQSFPFGDQFYPFTDANAPGTADDATPLHFTGKERDAESGNDYFGARYYSSAMGRFMSPDPLGNFVADVSNPQTWNMYAYALNNPLKFVDPTGYDCAYLNNAGDGIESLDQNSNSQECTKNGGYWADGAITNFEVNDNGSYRFTSLDSNLNTLYTNFSGGGNTGSTSSLDVMSYFFNYQIQQRQLQQSPSLWSLTPEQRIKQIALAQPTICGGGAFAYGGRSVDAGPANGFAGGIIEADSNSGISKGALFEAGGGEGIVGGGGLVVANSSSGVLGSEGLAYGGAGVELPGAHASVGEVGFNGGIGVYGDVSAGGREVGAGAYLNVTTNAACMAAHK